MCNSNVLDCLTMSVNSKKNYQSSMRVWQYKVSCVNFTSVFT